MARIDWVRVRLENWARWCQQASSAGLGYPSQAAFARMALSSARARESTIPVLSIDAAEINDAVESLKLKQSHLYLVLIYTYAKGWPRDVVAKKMRRAESTISQNLCEADLAIKRWLDEKLATAQRKRANAEALAAYQSRNK